MGRMLHNCCTHIFIYCSSCLLAAIHIINAIDKTHTIRQIIQSMVNTTTVGGSRYNVTVTPIHVSGLDSDYECRVDLAGQGVRLHSCWVGKWQMGMGLHPFKNEKFSHTSAQYIDQTVRRNLLLSDALSKTMGFKNIQKKSCLPLKYEIV